VKVARGRYIGVMFTKAKREVDDVVKERPLSKLYRQLSLELTPLFRERFIINHTLKSRS
jgi:hypothetical protein